MRTMASTRSHGATPNTSTLNSRDIHFGHNTSTSSGSHTLEMNVTRESIDAMAHRIETAEVHDDSSQSGSRSINSPKKDRDRDFSAPSGSEDHLDEVDELDHYNHKAAPPVPQGAHDEFNYSYYKISYDTSHQYQSAIQNANDNDDNVSHDSYHLTEEPGTPESLDNVLHSDDDGLLPEAGEEEGEGQRSRLHSEEEKGDEMEKDQIKREKAAEEGGGNVTAKEKTKEEGEDSQTTKQNGERQVEIQIVEKVETISSFQKSPSVEKRELGELEEKNSENGHEVGGGRRDSPEEIQYVLHRRVVSRSPDTAGVKMIQSKSAPQHLASIKQTSPVKAVGSPPISLTRKHHKAELERIKTSLTTPIFPASTSPQSKSPGSKRAFDLLKYNRLPPRDSYSCIDDSVSPSMERDIMSHIRTKHEKPEVPAKPSIPKKPLRDAEKSSMKLPGLTPIQPEHVQLVPPKAESEDLTPTPDSDTESESPLPKDSPLEEELNQVLSECGAEQSSSSSSDVEQAKERRARYRINSQNKDNIPFADDSQGSTDENPPRLNEGTQMTVSVTIESPSEELQRELGMTEMVESPSEVFEKSMEETEPEQSPTDDLEIKVKAAEKVESPSDKFEKTLEAANMESPSDEFEKNLEAAEKIETLSTKFKKQMEGELEAAEGHSQDDLLDKVAPSPSVELDISSEDDVEQPDADDFEDLAYILEAQRRPTLEAIALQYDSDIEDPKLSNLSPSDEFEKSMEDELDQAAGGAGRFSGDDTSDDGDSLPPPPPPMPHSSISSEGDMESPDAADYDIDTAAAILRAQRAPTMEAHYPLSDQRLIELPPDIAAVPAPIDISSESDVENDIESLPDIDQFEQKFEMELNVEEEEESMQLLNEHGEMPSPQGEPGQHKKTLSSSDSSSSDSDTEHGATGGFPAPPMLDISSESDVEHPTADEFPDPVAILEAGVYANPYMIRHMRGDDTDLEPPPPPPPPPPMYDDDYAYDPRAPPPLPVVSGSTLSGYEKIEEETFETLSRDHDIEDDPLESLEQLDQPYIAPYDSDSEGHRRKESDSDSSSDSDLEDVGPILAQRQLALNGMRIDMARQQQHAEAGNNQGQIIENPTAGGVVLPMTTSAQGLGDNVFSNPYAESFSGGPPQAPPRTSSVQHRDSASSSPKDSPKH